jgi:hypothetical protein
VSIFIIGGTAFVGHRLVRLLVARGWAFRFRSRHHCHCIIQLGDIAPHWSDRRSADNMFWR